MDAHTAEKELEWYIRDHLFRQGGTGRKQFQRASLPDEMVKLYLRYRNSDPIALAHAMAPVIDNLISLQVVHTGANGNLEMPSNLTRLQCSKCFYISYLAESEQRQCLRCPSTELHNFPKKK